MTERQEMRELTQLDEGVRRYHREVSKQGAGETTAGLGLVYVGMKALIPAIEGNIARLEEGGNGNLPSQVPLAYQYMVGMKADAIAYIASKVVVSASVNRGKLTRTAMQIANLIEEDYRFEELEQAEPALANSMSKKAQRWSSSGARRRIMRKAAQVAGIATMGWTEAEKLKLGVKLVELYIETTGLAQLVETQEGKMTFKLIEMTELAAERLASRHASLEGERPVNKPMIAPPKPWTSPISGGYLTPRMKTDLVRGVGQATRDEVFSCDMPEVYAAVNRVQATPWRINVGVLDTMQAVFDEGGTLGGLPQADDMALPERPESIDRKCSPDDMPEDMCATFNEWKQAAREVHEFNGQLKSKRLALITKLNMAQDVRDEESIWFPHSLDFRGRVYSMTTELSPQGDDIAKSLIEFGNGKALGETGGYWLAVHIANLFGVDKVSFDDRVEWTVTQSDKLVESAMNPLDGDRFWAKADDPWCALAACFEWAGFQIEGDDYVSHLPIAMDGSCSGIQHFSAMLRDAEGGRAVNLTNLDQPSDIYTEVLYVVQDMLAENSDPLAKVWMDKVDRKIVKRPCMTFAYSVTSVGIRDQIASEMRKQTDGQYLPGHENWQAAMFLAPIVEAAIRQVVKRAAEAMDWLKLAAKALTAEEIPTSWVTPLGFPVVQPYRKAKGQLFKVWFQGQRIRLTLRVESRTIDGRKQASSVAPNFVHSLDATHLMMVVNRLYDEGITPNTAMIHDSFGVHACDVDELHYVIRDEFIKLYSEDILTRTYQSTLLALPGDKWPDLPTPPEAGDLNLEEVRDADFFFA
jgi:DNA-directed RNA polymerase, mitochondrial